MRDATVRTVLAVHVSVVLALLGGLSTAGMTPQVLSQGSWWIPVLVINAGILAGNLAMLVLSRRPDAAYALLRAGRREDLEDSRRIVVEQLRALDAEQDKLAPDDYARERSELLSVGTRASRELAESVELAPEAQATQIGLPPGFLAAGGPPTSPATSPPTLGPIDALAFRLQIDREADPDAFDKALARLGYRSRGTSGEWRGAAYTLAIVGLVGLLFSFAGDQSRERTEGMGMTGGDAVGMAEAPTEPAPEDPRIAPLRARLASDPNDLGALNELTELALAGQDARTAMQLNEQALKLAPKDADARVLRAVLLAVIDQRDRAFEALDEVLADDPKHVRGLFFRGLLAIRTDPAEAVGYLERALAVEDRPEIRAALEEARAAAAGGPVAAAGAVTEPSSAAGDEVLASGTVSLAEGARTSGQVLYVSLRLPGGGGPPVAALRLPPGPFPMSFTITRADMIPMMAGRPLPGAADVVATLDADGNAATKDGDPTSKADGVALGTKDVALVLR